MKKLLLFALSLFFFGFVYSQEILPSSIDTTTLKSPFFLVSTETEKIKYELKDCERYEKDGKRGAGLPVELIEGVIGKSTLLYLSGNILYSNTQYDDYQCKYTTSFFETIKPVVEEIRVVKPIVISSIQEPVVETVVQEKQEEILSGNETDPRIEMFNIVRTKYIKENGSKKAMEMAKKFITAYLVIQGKLGDNEEIGKVIYNVFIDYISNN